MTTVCHLPPEILWIVFEELETEDSIAELRTIRLVCRSFAEIASPLLFRQLTLGYPGSCLPWNDKSLCKAESIAAHPKYRSFVMVVEIEFGAIYGAYEELRYRDQEVYFGRLMQCLGSFATRTEFLAMRIEKYNVDYHPLLISGDNNIGSGSLTVAWEPVAQILRIFPNLTVLMLERWPPFQCNPQVDLEFLTTKFPWSSRLENLALRGWVADNDQTLLQLMSSFQKSLRRLYLSEVVLKDSNASWRPFMDALRNDFSLEDFGMYQLKGGLDTTDDMTNRRDDTSLVSNVSSPYMWPQKKRGNIMKKICLWVLNENNEDPFALWCDIYRDRKKELPDLSDDSCEFPEDYA